MSHFNKSSNPRRRLLVQALAGGLFSSVLPGPSAAAWSLFGDRPEKLPEGRSVFRITGNVSVNGAAATLRTVVRPGDVVETRDNSEMIFVVGSHSMIIRSNSRLEIERPAKSATSLLISGLRLLTGKLLSVSRDSPMRIATSTATIGIRGTGWYAEADPEQTYFCTCYGTTQISANRDPESSETVNSKHHDRPLYILDKAAEGKSIREAPFINHTDQELMLIEALVGRTPPFVFPKDDYLGPRRDY